MKSIESILFPTDFSELSQEALPYAAQLAETFSAVLHIFHVEELHDLRGLDPEQSLAHREIVRALHDNRSELLERLREQHAARGIEVRRATRRGVAAGPEILDYAKEQGIDLIVMATHGRRGFRRWVLGSVAEEVVRHSSRPVLTVGGEATTSEGRILVPVDFSETSDDTIRYAACLSEETGADIELLHVVDVVMPPPLLMEAYVELPWESQEALRKEAKERLEKLAAASPLDGKTTKVTVKSGPAAATILEHITEENIGLAVIGGHGLTGLGRFLLGGVAERIVAQAQCPILTVKHKEAVSEEAVA